MTHGSERPRGERPKFPEGVAYDDKGLVPAIVQDAATGAVLMLAYMDREALEATLRTREVHFHSRSRDKLYWFLSGWLGGPKLYVERFGHPRLRARHLPFAIGVTERDQWLACMTRAMSERRVEPELARELLQSLALTADWMRNRFG